MLDLQTRIATLKRPALLARAARFGVDDYRRDIHLRPILKTERLPRHAAALMQLLELEAEQESTRKGRAGDYRPARHVAVLIAILGEAQLMRATSLHSV
ncbi:MAG: DUF6477 family protein [Yoonia sp.]|uniref:DUF6477 family protein n=1 Tax=Yoonia sp. TaxID=2212373 RepID=UPI003EF8C949